MKNVMTQTPAAITSAEELANEAFCKKDFDHIARHAAQLDEAHNVPTGDVAAHAQECYRILESAAPAADYVLSGMDALKVANASSLTADRPDYRDETSSTAKAQLVELTQGFQLQVLEALAPLAKMDEDLLEVHYLGIADRMDRAFEEASNVMEEAKRSGWKTHNWKGKNLHHRKASWVLHIEKIFCESALDLKRRVGTVPNKIGTRTFSRAKSPEKFQKTFLFWLGVCKQIRS